MMPGRPVWMVAVAALLLGLGGCARTPPEQALRDTIAEVQGAIERRDAQALQRQLASDFIGSDGLDRDGARRLAQLVFLRHRDVGASFGPLQIAMQERNATVRFTAALSGGRGGLLPDTGQIYNVETGWRLDDGEWLLTSAHWTAKL